MPEESDSDQEKDESEIEAEMLRMMEQEATAESPSEEQPAERSGGGEEDEMMRMMEQAMADSHQDASAPSDAATDEMLEMEMLKAMQGNEAGAVPAPFQAFPAPSEAEGLPANLSRILGVNVKITVELGGNHVPIKEVLSWGDGTLVELERMDREPVDVLVNGRLFARGEVVVVGESFGVKITELLTVGKQ